jgi:hypothetical protein
MHRKPSLDPNPLANLESNGLIVPDPHSSSFVLDLDVIGSMDGAACFVGAGVDRGDDGNGGRGRSDEPCRRFFKTVAESERGGALDAKGMASGD